MIISASRRTDIPAFYAEWLIRRVRAGYCTVPNPFNRQQVSRISLRPEEVDVLVFWTRNPRPLMRHLDELEARGLRYLFLFTLIGYPRAIDPKSPPATFAIDAFRELAERIGPDRLVWRYDPLLFTPLTGEAFHLANYARLAEALRGSTRRSVVSLVERYRKAEPRLQTLAGTPARLEEWPLERTGALLQGLAGLAEANGMQMQSCASTVELRPFGVPAGRCIDDRLIHTAFGIRVPDKKDPSQRPACGCVASRDIGMYDSCLYGCPYCYATQSFARARAHFDQHDPNSPSLLGRYEAPFSSLLAAPDESEESTAKQ